MSNKFKDISIKTHTYYLFNDNVNIKNFDPSNNKILIYYIGYVAMIKDSKYVRIYSVNSLYLIINKVNRN